MPAFPQPCRLPYWSAAWSSADLETFVRWMHAQEEPVSSSLMKFDRRYALEQLTLAHTLADPHLQSLAVELFEQMEAQMVR